MLFSSFRKWLKEFQGFAGRISKYLKEVSEMMKTVNSLDKMHEIIGSVFMENEVLEERIG